MVRSTRIQRFAISLVLVILLMMLEPYLNDTQQHSNNAATWLEISSVSFTAGFVVWSKRGSKAVGNGVKRGC